MPNPYGHSASGQFRSKPIWSGVNKSPNFQISIAAYLDDTDIQQKKRLLSHEIKQQRNALEDNTDRAKQSEFHIIKAMQASYMMAYGMSRFLGGGMAQAFFTVHSLSVSAIGAWKAIAAAVLGSGSVVQAAVMYVALAAAAAQLIQLAKGNTQLSRQMRGLTTSLHGMAGMIDSFSR